MDDKLSVGILRASEGAVRPFLIDRMFRSRDEQFRKELGWKLETDVMGRERDEYDYCNPVYLLIKNSRGGHVGSTRLLPTMGPTMVYEKFSNLDQSNFARAHDIWEVTRFFVGRHARAEAAPLLMLSGLLFAEQIGVTRYVGVVATESTRAYSLIGWKPDIIETVEHEEESISYCMWSISQSVKERLRRRAKLDTAGLASIEREAQIAALAYLSSSLEYSEENVNESLSDSLHVDRRVKEIELGYL